MSSKKRGAEGDGKREQKRGPKDKKQLSKKEDKEEIEYEDPFGDDEEIQEEVIDCEGVESIVEGLSKLDYVEVQAPVFLEDEEDEEDEGEYQAFVPGRDKLDASERLEADPSAYKILHSLGTPWPCLSLSVVPDRLGIGRTRCPLSMAVAMGTQAEEGEENSLIVALISNVFSTDESDDEDGITLEGVDQEPQVEFKSVVHPGAVNRLRVMPREPCITATMSDDGSLYLWNILPLIRQLSQQAEAEVKQNDTWKKNPHIQVGAFKNPVEGYALCWSPHNDTLISGSNDGRIFSYDCAPNKRIRSPDPYTSHSGSVEDLEWSPTEAQVFSSCSSDKTVKIWDLRMKTAARSIRASDTDVNAISWNQKVPYLLVSGADDGSFRIWDLRSVKETNSECSSVAHIKWHSDQITSIEWSPLEDSVITVSSADDQVTVWDMSIEEDPEEDKTKLDVPPQLLFVHLGQKEPKEVHWHPQIPGLLLSTGWNGVNLFNPRINEEDQEESDESDD